MFDNTVVPPFVLDSLFLANSRNCDFVEGTSKRIALRGENSLSLGIILLLVTLPLTCWLVTDWYTRLSLNLWGSKVTGTVVARAEVIGEDSSDYYITYRYTVARSQDNHDYSQKQKVSYETYNRLTIGSAVTVSFFPDNPGFSRLAGDDVDNTDYNSLVLLLVGLLLLWGWSSVFTGLEYRAFVRNGRLLFGTVIGCSAKLVSDDDGESYTITVHYDFTTPDGYRKEGNKYLNMKVGTFEHWAEPAKGTPVAVLYVNDRLFQML